MAFQSPRSPIAWLLIPLILGYLLAPNLPHGPILLAALGTALTVGALGAALGTSSRWGDIAVPCLLFPAAMLLAASYLQHRTAPPPDWEWLPPREATFSLQVHRLFGSGSPSGSPRGFATVTEADPHLSDLIGEYVYFSMGPTEGDGQRWSRGTRLRTVGVLARITPEEAETSPFLAYLRQAGAHFQYRRVTLLEEPGANRGFFGFTAREHDRIEGFLRRGFNERSASLANIYVAMLLGKRAELADAQRTAFLQSGTLHLFAISGLHIGVIAFALHNLLTLLRLPQKTAALIGLSLLLCFVGITGAPPSAVRAFLMVLFFWGAHFVGRAPNPVAALVNSAILVLLLFPQQLWSPGFQLSYAVVSGILLLGLPLGKYLCHKWALFSGLPPDSMTGPQRFMAGATDQFSAMLAVSLAASLLSAPLSIHYFGVFTPGAVLLNLVMIPAAGLVLVAGFINVFLSYLGLGLLGVPFNHAAWVVIAAMEGIVGASVSLPVLFWQGTFASPWHGPFIVCLLIASLLLCAHRGWRAPYFHFITPFLLFVLSLLVAARLTFLS